VCVCACARMRACLRVCVHVCVCVCVRVRPQGLLPYIPSRVCAQEGTEQERQQWSRHGLDLVAQVCSRALDRSLLLSQSLLSAAQLSVRFACQLAFVLLQPQKTNSTHGHPNCCPAGQGGHLTVGRGPRHAPWEPPAQRVS